MKSLSASNQGVGQSMDQLLWETERGHDVILLALSIGLRHYECLTRCIYYMIQLLHSATPITTLTNWNRQCDRQGSHVM